MDQNQPKVIFQVGVGKGAVGVLAFGSPRAFEREKG